MTVAAVPRLADGTVAVSGSHEAIAERSRDAPSRVAAVGARGRACLWRGPANRRTRVVRGIGRRRRSRSLRCHRRVGSSGGVRLRSRGSPRPRSRPHLDRGRGARRRLRHRDRDRHGTLPRPRCRPRSRVGRGRRGRHVRRQFGLGGAPEYTAQGLTAEIPPGGGTVCGQRGPDGHGCPAAQAPWMLRAAQPQ